MRPPTTRGTEGGATRGIVRVTGLAGREPVDGALAVGRVGFGAPLVYVLDEPPDLLDELVLDEEEQHLPDEPDDLLLYEDDPLLDRDDEEKLLLDRDEEP